MVFAEEWTAPTNRFSAFRCLADGRQETAISATLRRFLYRRCCLGIARYRLPSLRLFLSEIRHALAAATPGLAIRVGEEK
jgi:hypothetical protein